MLALLPAAIARDVEVSRELVEREADKGSSRSNRSCDCMGTHGAGDSGGEDTARVWLFGGDGEPGGENRIRSPSSESMAAHRLWLVRVKSGC